MADHRHSDSTAPGASRLADANLTAAQSDPLTLLPRDPHAGTEIPVEHCLPLAGRLQQLLSRIPADMRLHEQTEHFIAGLKLAVSHNAPVRFY